LIPIVHGAVHHFSNRGLYNGLFLMADEETNSYWDHITGECVHGPLQGHQLEHLPEPLLQMNAGQALQTHPDAQIAISKPPLLYRIISKIIGLPHARERGFLPPRFRGTMAEVDPRRPEMERGLGVWTERDREESVHRYYPMETLQEQSNALLDDLAGRRVLVYLDPETKVPAAIYTEASGYTWQGNDLQLDAGDVLRHGALYDDAGKKQIPARPMQMFTRWYGFVLTFPDCEVYAGAHAGEETGSP